MIGNKAEAAYRRGDLFDKRRKLMDAWAAYCATPKWARSLRFSGRYERSTAFNHEHATG